MLVRSLPEQAALARPSGVEWDGWTVQTEMAATIVDMLAIVASERRLLKPFRVERPARIDPNGKAAKMERTRARVAKAQRAAEKRGGPATPAQPGQYAEGEFARSIFAKLPGVPSSVFAAPARELPAGGTVIDGTVAPPAAGRAVRPYDPNFARSIFAKLPGVPSIVFGGDGG